METKPLFLIWLYKHISDTVTVSDTVTEDLKTKYILF